MPRRALAVPLYKDGSGTWYADLRRYGVVGGKRVSLRTKDRQEAEELCKELLSDLEAKAHAKGLYQEHEVMDLGKGVRDFLVWKAEYSDVRDRTLEEDERALTDAIGFFGADRPLHSIRPRDVELWLAHLRQTVRPKRGKVVAPATLRNRIKPLSGLYTWAQYCDMVEHNPVRALAGPVKPRAQSAEAKFLQPEDVALALEAVRRLPAKDMPHQHALVSTFALTGGRRREVFGVEVGDVDVDKKTLTFRPNQWRELKTAKSHRVVTLWPQLRTVLKAWLKKRPPGGVLLFPSTHPRVRSMEEERMYRDVRTLCDRLNEVLGWSPARALDPERISAKVFRNSYAAARLQTLDRGMPVSMYTVARELGHGSLDMLDRIYGHLGKVSHRKELVEFRLRHYQKALDNKLMALDEKLREST